MKEHIENSIRKYFNDVTNINSEVIPAELADYIVNKLEENYIFVAYPIGKGSDNFENKN
jgi:hypothetical protein